MIKIWAKLIKNNKMKKDFLFLKEEETFEYNDLWEYLVAICEHFDLSTPILLDHHLAQLVEYRMMKFLPDDFVDSFPFDRMEIINMSE